MTFYISKKQTNKKTTTTKKTAQVAREAMKESKTLNILLPLTAVFLAF